MTAITTPAPSSSTTIQIASWNLRYDSQPNNISVSQTIASLPDPLSPPSSYYPNTNEQPWSTRRIHVARELQEAGVQVVGLQEALVRQVDDLKELLGNDWAWVGVGRDDGKQAGEYSPLFYQKSILNLVDWDTFWLSDTPFVPSKYPTAGSYRICTLAHFSPSSSSSVPSSSSPKSFTLMNTHFDDRSDDQRRLAASLILHRAKYEAWKTRRAVIVLGDFNSAQSGTDSGAYDIITGSKPPVPLPQDFLAKFPLPTGLEGGDNDFVMVDVKGVTPRDKVSGHYATFTGFTRAGNSSMFSRIDFVLGGSNGGWTSESYKVGNTLYDDGVWASDHRPVFSGITFK